MDSSNETQHGFMSTEDIPFHFLRRETFEGFLDIWRRIHTHFMIYDRRNMEDELLRLITFLHFPGHTGQDIRILAIAGFYYYGESDIVVCYCCGLWRRNWTNTDEPWAIHRGLSVRCLFIRNNREVNRPYYGLTERGLRNLEQTTLLLQQTTVASGPSFVRSGHEIQAGIISGILRREQYNNRDIERVERHNILPVANLQRRETHVGDLHMGVDMRNSHEFYLDVESRTISIANERRNRTCNIPHLGRTLNTSELSTDIAQSHSYTPQNENNSGILESIETSIQRRYGSESEGFDEEADRSGVQNMHSTFRSVQDETDSTSDDETVPKQAVRMPTTLINSNISRRLLRSISEPLPHQYSYRTPRHIYTENTNCHDENHRCTNESTDAFYSVLDVAFDGNDNHKEQSGVHDDAESFTTRKDSDLGERDHANTILEQHDLEETIIKRRISLGEEAKTEMKIDSRDFAVLEALVPECHDRTSDTGPRTETLITNINDTETILTENSDDQYHLPRNTHTTGSKNVLHYKTIQRQKSLSSDEESASGVTDTDSTNLTLLATPEKDVTDRAKRLRQKKSKTFCETHTEDNSRPNELSENVKIPKTKSGTAAPSESEQAVAGEDSVVDTLNTIKNQDINYGSFQSTKSKITQISEIVAEEPAEQSINQSATTVEAPEVFSKCLKDAKTFSRREELGQVDEVNDDTASSSLFSVPQRQGSYRTRLLDTEKSETTRPESYKTKTLSMQKKTGMANISVLMNRHNGTLTPEFNLVHGQRNIEQTQRMPDDFQSDSSLDNAKEARTTDALLKPANVSKADQGEQPSVVYQIKEFVDTVFYNNEDMGESGRTEEVAPETLPTLLRGPRSNMGCDDIFIRSKMKVRQRHLSEGDSPRDISLGPRCEPHTIQQNYSTVESRRRSFRNNSVSPSEQLADAGFYNAGRDYIRCYSCEIEFQHSKIENNIWIEHAKASPGCEYLLQRKGQDFIQAVVEGDDSLVQMYLNIFTRECRRKPFNADRAGGDMNETVSEDAFEGVVLTVNATTDNSY